VVDGGSNVTAGNAQKTTVMVMKISSKLVLRMMEGGRKRRTIGIVRVDVL
jgi:hypothetical protein